MWNYYREEVLTRRKEINLLELKLHAGSNMNAEFFNVEC
jgi:hypothetical protein